MKNLAQNNKQRADKAFVLCGVINLGCDCKNNLYHSDNGEWCYKVALNLAIPDVSGSLRQNVPEVQNLISTLNELKEKKLLEAFKNENQKLITELWSLVR